MYNNKIPKIKIDNVSENQGTGSSGRIDSLNFAADSNGPSVVDDAGIIYGDADPE